MDDDQATQAGKAFALSHLAVIESAHGRDAALRYAAGYVRAASEVFVEKSGPRPAWDFFFQTAENIMEWQNERERASGV
jgi:hypothetical protein